jgi:hypothetical protein
MNAMGECKSSGTQCKIVMKFTILHSCPGIMDFKCWHASQDAEGKSKSNGTSSEVKMPELQEWIKNHGWN